MMLRGCGYSKVLVGTFIKGFGLYARSPKHLLGTTAVFNSGHWPLSRSETSEGIREMFRRGLTAYDSMDHIPQTAVFSESINYGIGTDTIGTNDVNS